MAKAILPPLRETTRFDFTYNGYGQRIQKKYTSTTGSNSVLGDSMTNETHDYSYDLNGRLIKEDISIKYKDGVTSQKTIEYLYDGSEIVGFIYTNLGTSSTYYYDKNQYGDVIAILDNNCSAVVKYKYDAYGNCTPYAVNDFNIAAINPIRYRGYYFDTGLDFYYLNARYYNPQWRRFISPDSTDYLDTETHMDVMWELFKTANHTNK